MWVKYSDQYEISSDGHIRNSKTKRVLREFLGADGYLRTQFDGKTRLVHRVVASVFLENPSNLPEVNHIDGNKTNNSIENLEWCTRNDNLKHAYSCGLRTARGTHNAHSKLSEDDVYYIRTHYIPRDIEFGASGLAKRFGVASQTISAVTSGQNWHDPVEVQKDHSYDIPDRPMKDEEFEV